MLQVSKAKMNDFYIRKKNTCSSASGAMKDKGDGCKKQSSKEHGGIQH